MANKNYLDQEGLERLVSYINAALKTKADAGEIPDDVLREADLADYVKNQEFLTALAAYATNDSLTDVVREADLNAYATNDSLNDVVRENDLNAYVTNDSLNDVVRENALADYATLSSLNDVVRENDLADYVTNDDLSELRQEVTGLYHFKGSVDNLEALLAIENPSIGDTYNLVDTGMNAAWTGEVWDEFGSVTDLSSYMLKEEVDCIPLNTVNAILFGSKVAAVSDIDGMRLMVSNNKPVVEIKLVDDLDISEIVTVSEGKKVTVDLGGNEINRLDGYVFNVSGGELILKNGSVSSTARAVHVEAGGSLTLDNAEITSVNDVAVDVSGTGSSVVMNSGKVTAQESGILVTTGGALELNGGEIECWDNCPIQGNGTPGQGEINVVMNGGKLVAHIQSAGWTACGVYMPNSGSFTMNGGEIVSEGCGVCMRAGEVNLNGGSISTTGNETFKGKVGDSRIVVGSYAVVYDQSANYPAVDTMELNIGKDMILQGTAGDVSVLLADGASANINDQR